MYIAAKLPENYGEFQRIREENYPFNRNFTDYIETIVSLGNDLDMGISDLIGYIEDSLMADERLPDIPDGNQAVEFRFSIDNQTIEDYYQEQEISNRQITLLIIRMTLRLSVRFGTSLPRLRNRISRIDTETVEYEEVKPAVRLVTRPKTEVVQEVIQEPVQEVINEPVQEVINEPVQEPAQEPVQEPVQEVAQEPVQETKTQEKDDNLVSRLERLTQRSAELLESDPIDDGTVVETNPLLADFFSEEE